MSEIILNKNELQRGIERIIETQNHVMDRINNTSAYTEEECKQRLELIKQRDTLDYLLKILGMQSFEYRVKDESINIKII